MTALGLLGALICVFAYMLLSVERIDPKGVPYFVMNGIASLMLLVAMGAEFDGGDAGGILMEAAWVVISLFGLYRAVLRKREGKEEQVE